MQGKWVQSLAQELRSHMPQSNKAHVQLASPRTTAAEPVL